MATQLQEDLAEAIVKNKSLPRYKRKNKQELVVSAGYSEITAQSKAGQIIDSKGVKKALSSFGLTEELITTALVNDINDKPKRRFHELNLGAEILGMKAEKQVNNKTLVVLIAGESANRYGVQIASQPGNSSE